MENMTNVSTVCTNLRTYFLLWGFNYLNDKFCKLISFTLLLRKSSSYFTFRFETIVNKLQNFSTIIELDKNWLIYELYTNLKYSQDYDSFD